MGNPGPVGSHGISAGNCPQDNGIGIGPLLIPDSDTLNIRQDSKVLPDLPIQASLPDLLPENSIGFPQDSQFLLIDAADYPYSQSRSRERLPPDYILRQAKQLTQFPDLILEEVPQGFDQFQVHIFRQAAHIVMALDLDPFALTNTLYHIRIKGTLDQETGITDLTCLFFKDPDEFLTDDLPLLFRILNSGQFIQKPLPGIYINQRYFKVLAKG